MRAQKWLLRSSVVAASAAVALVAGSLPASAATLSTTGASGRTKYFENGTYLLYAHDPLTDGHCARWQVNTGSGWSYTGDSACSSTEILAGIAQSGSSVRICRTGVGNCSGSVKL
ncbi:hypothetical protein [Actinoplanes sp. HUAS TT8]|uniref:hypothetical protein n=1 Tax=Actinoplanes sp. HUAS TT8 TaxID=3447453 RepID=UPI003F527B0D